MSDRKEFEGTLNLGHASFFPLSRKVAAVVVDGKSFLTDGNRFVERDSLAACLETRVTRRMLQFGEKIS